MKISRNQIRKKNPRKMMKNKNRERVSGMKLFLTIKKQEIRHASDIL